ncbi:phosphatase PAP2 family protein [Candidatus Woesebacteria bacterium]|nr:phosphatase PAP2 family protein [Candidatus Woesebacteria bacterium]
MTNLLITFLASFLIWLMFGGLLILWLIDGKIKREQVLHALLAAGVAWGVAQVIKAVFPTTRPFELNGLIPLTLIPSSDGAFPSGHAAAAFALATTIWLHDKKVGSAFVIAALIVGAARVWGNVHYPIDILAGAVLGIVAAFVIEKVHLRKFIP